tara:strand:+ start:4333 stop:4554 length:222 start_codon:yes stop_codon:yes gene_type:complete
MIYVIINSDDVDTVRFSEVVESSQHTLRYSMDTSETIVKFEGDTPSFLEGKTQYTKNQMREIINNPENGWILN